MLFKTWLLKEMKKRKLPPPTNKEILVINQKGYLFELDYLGKEFPELAQECRWGPMPRLVLKDGVKRYLHHVKIQGNIQIKRKIVDDRYKKYGISWRINQSGSNAERKKIEKVFSKTAGRCSYCAQKFSDSFFPKSNYPTIDHVVPRNPKNGQKYRHLNSLRNLVPCCFGCNVCKGNKSAEEFMALLNKEKEEKIMEGIFCLGNRNNMNLV